MKVFLDRFKTSDQGTFGMFVKEGDSEPLCFTVERPYTGDHPCIPAGVYNVIPHDSPAHPDTWEVTNVPGRTGILIHPANTYLQLLGCIAPGTSLGEVNGVPAVLGSQNAFAMLKSILPDSFQLEITGVNQ